MPLGQKKELDVYVHGGAWWCCNSGFVVFVKPYRNQGSRGLLHER